jgi:hypothetical protein
MRNKARLTQRTVVPSDKISRMKGLQRPSLMSEVDELSIGGVRFIWQTHSMEHRYYAVRATPSKRVAALRCLRDALMARYMYCSQQNLVLRIFPANRSL